MRDKGFEVHAASGPGEDLNHLATSEKIRVHVVPMTRGVSPLKDVVAFISLWWLFVKIRPTIVHGSTAKAGLLSMMAAALCRIPVRVYTLRGLISELGSGPVNMILRALEWIACRCANQVLAVSRSVADTISREKLCPGEKIGVLENGSSKGVDAEDRFNPLHVNKQDVETLLSQYLIPMDATVMGFVGRIVRDKGIVELAAAWQRLKRDYPALFLVMIGPAEPWDPVPSEILAALRGDPRVIILDFVPNKYMPKHYLMMDLVVLPTYREGFPNVPLEAAAMGLPVVATRVTGCVDAVVEDVTGTLVAARDPAALENAIRFYLNDPALRKTRGKAGRQRVMTDFRPELIWDAQYRVYVRLLNALGLSVAETKTDPV